MLHAHCSCLLTVQNLRQKVKLLRGCGGSLTSGLLPHLSNLEVALDVTAVTPGSPVEPLLPALLWLRSSSFSIGIVQQLTQLVVLDLSGSSKLAFLPAACSRLQHLQHLDLSKCSFLQDIRPVAELTELRFLDVSGCSLVKPPDLGKLQRLQQLHMRGCLMVERIPSLGQLTALLHLDCSGCANISAVDDMGKLPSLTTLLLHGCSNLRSVPSLSSLVALRHLDLSECRSIGCPNLSALSLLTVLCLAGAENVWADICADLAELSSNSSSSTSSSNASHRTSTGTSTTSVGAAYEAASAAAAPAVHEPGAAAAEVPALPEWLCSLQWLMRLELSDLGRLPAGLGQLQALQELHLQEMSFLTVLPVSATQLVSLRQLTLSSCEALTQLPQDISRLSALQVLKCEDCSKLAALPTSLGSMTGLQVLSLAGCEGITKPLCDSLQVLQHLSCLQYLDLSRGVGETEQLQEVIPGHLQLLGYNTWAVQTADMVSQLVAK